MREYYDQRAPEYDDWWDGTGLFATRDRPGWHDEVQALIDTLSALPPRRTLDIACGTAFLSRHLRGDVTGLDASPTMVSIAATRLSHVVEGDALHPPFPDGAFERVATSHFYGHLEDPDRAAFLDTAGRLAPELLIVDSARREDVPAARMDPRVLNDGSRHAVYKRWFELDELAAETGGTVIHAGRWFVAVLA